MSLALPILRGPQRGLRWIVGSGSLRCWLGTYEHDKRLRFTALVRDADVVFDVGAHAGYYTLLASVLVGDQGAVVAFEPGPGNLRYLRRHVRMNHRRNVTIVEAAISDRSGTGRFLVDTLSLDDLWEGGQIGAPDVVNIDVEGREDRVLRGARHMLRDAHPVVFLATHGAEARQACLDLLAGLPYVVETFAGCELICRPI